MANIGFATLSIIPSLRGLDAAVGKQLGGPIAALSAKAGAQSASAVGGGFTSKLGSIAKGATLPFIGIGVAAIASAKGVEDAQNTILRSTGATGKAADGLLASFRNVAKGSAAPLGTVATVLSEVSQRTGLVGKPLEGLTSQIVTFNRITKDSPIGVQQLTQSLAGFNISGAKTGPTLDKIFTISQKTGVPLADLVSTLGTAGPILRQFNFPVEQAASVMAKLDKAGVPATNVMAGLKKAFTTFAKEGKDPKTALIGVLGQIDALVKSGDKVGAQHLGAQIFGARGVGLVDAAIAGKLSIADLTKTVDVSGKGILKTAASTTTMGAKLGILKNNAQLALAQLGGPLLDIASSGLKAIVPVVQTLASGFATLPGPVKGVAVGLVALGAVAGPIGKLVGSIGKIGKSAFTAGKALFGASKSAVTFFTSGRASSLAKGLLDAGKSVLTYGKNALIAAVNIGKQVAAFVAQKVAAFAAAVAQKAMAAAQWLLNAAMTANPIGLIVAGIALLVAGFILAYKNIKPFRDAVDALGRAFLAAGKWIVSGLGSAFAWIVSHWSKLFTILSTPIRLAVRLYTDEFKIIINVIRAVVDWVRSHWPLLTAILTAPIRLAVAGIQASWDLIKSGAGAVFHGVKSAFDRVVNFVTGLPGRIASAASGLFDGIKDAFKGAINWVIKAWNDLGFTLPKFDTHIPGVGKVGGWTISTPNIPTLDSGGITTRPTLAALSMNRIPEVTVPIPMLSHLMDERLSKALANKRESVTVEQHNHWPRNDMPMADVKYAGDQLAWQVRNTGRRPGG